MSSVSIAAIYARVSSAEQGDEDKVSLESQIEHCRRRAEADGFETPAEHVYRDMASGGLSAEERPGLRALLEAVGTGEVSRIYVYRYDRLARDLAISEDVMKGILAKGATVLSLDGADTSNDLIRAVFGGVAAWERAQITERTGRGRRAAREAGKWTQGMAPYGYRRGDEGQLVQDARESRVVRDIFRWTVEGMGRIGIACRLNQAGVLSPLVELIVPGRKRKRRVRTNDPKINSDPDQLARHMEDIGAVFAADRPPTWAESSVERIILNTVHFGETGGQPVNVEPCPILTKEQFETANAARSARNRKGAGPRRRRLLTGLIRCAKCGRAYVAHAGGGSKGRATVDYYFCAGRRNGSGCDAPAVRLKDTEMEVCELVSRLLAPKIDDQCIVKILQENDKTKIDELKNILYYERSEIEKLKARRHSVSSVSVELASAGVGKEGLADLASELRQLGSDIEQKMQKIGDITASLSRIHGSMAYSESEIKGAAWLASFSINSLDRLEADGSERFFIDPREILLRVVRSVVVMPDGAVEANVDTTDEALSDLIRFIADEALRLERTFTLPASDTHENQELDERLTSFVKATGL